MSESCYFCGEIERIEQHHIVPRRFNGDDTDENLVSVCPTCHSKLETLYDKRFYDELGVETEPETETGGECSHGDCTSKDTTILRNSHRDIEIAVCDGHRECCNTGNMMTAGCSRTDVTPVPSPNGVKLVCENHRVCVRGECHNQNIVFVDGEVHQTPLCPEHAGAHLAKRAEVNDE